jgi:transcriptional regulator with XRE-family HTH domain
MSKRKPLDKTQIRERRDRMLEAAAAADLSLTEGVREMRAIAGMTQEEFARHRGVSARVVKALELGQGNPTVATLNRIGEFFGLEVAFVPVRRTSPDAQPQPTAVAKEMPAPVFLTDREVGDSQTYAVLPDHLKKVIREEIQSAVSKALRLPLTEQIKNESSQPTKPADASTSGRPPAKSSPPTRKKKNLGSS